MLGELLVEAGVPEGCVSVLPGPGGDRRRRARRRPAGRTRSRSPARPRPARRSSRSRPTTSPGSRSSWAGSPRAWSSATPTGRRPSTTPRWPCSATPVRTAARGAASWSSSRSTTTSSLRSPSRTEHVKVGPPLDEATEMGPMISPAQRQVSLDYLAIGADEGAERVTGGDIPTGDPFGDGSYLTPAVLARGRQPDARRPGGDLRSGGVAHPLHGRSRRDPDRERGRLRALGVAVDRATSGARSASARRFAPACCR